MFESHCKHCQVGNLKPTAVLPLPLLATYPQGSLPDSVIFWGDSLFSWEPVLLSASTEASQWNSEWFSFQGKVNCECGGNSVGMFPWEAGSRLGVMDALQLPSLEPALLSSHPTFLRGLRFLKIQILFFSSDL